MLVLIDQPHPLFEYWCLSICLFIYYLFHLQVVVCILEYKISPNYFCGGLHTVKLDILVLGDLIKHFIPELSSHMEAIRYGQGLRPMHRSGSENHTHVYSHMYVMQLFHYFRSSSSSHISKSYSSEKPPRLMDSTTYEPPLFNALSLQWLMSLFTSCLPWKVRLHSLLLLLLLL